MSRGSSSNEDRTRGLRRLLELKAPELYPGIEADLDKELRSLPAFNRALRADRVVVQATVDQIHAFGMQTQVWTVNAGADMRRAIRWGVDGIITNLGRVHPVRRTGVWR